MQRVLEEVIINLKAAREAKVGWSGDLTLIKPDITDDEIRHLLRTLREYGYKVQRQKNVIRKIGDNKNDC